MLRSVANELPQDMVDQYVNQVHSGICPKCSGRDRLIYQSHSVYSLLLFTSEITNAYLFAHNDKNRQAHVSLLSLAGGAFPEIIMTPVQIIRNSLTFSEITTLTAPLRNSGELFDILLQKML